MFNDLKVPYQQSNAPNAYSIGGFDACVQQRLQRLSRSVCVSRVCRSQVPDAWLLTVVWRIKCYIPTALTWDIIASHDDMMCVALCAVVVCASCVCDTTQTRPLDCVVVVVVCVVCATATNKSTHSIKRARQRQRLDVPTSASHRIRRIIITSPRQCPKGTSSSSTSLTNTHSHTSSPIQTKSL